MKIVDKYYGYPIISPIVDDFNDVFDIQVDSIKNSEDEVLWVKIRIQMTNSEILKLIESGKAIFTIHFEESKTCFREIVQFKTLEYELKIPFGKIRDKIEVCGFITTTSLISNFKSDSMHQFYKDIDIVYEPYQIIGTSSGTTIELIKGEDDISEPKSIFAIVANQDDDVKVYGLDFNEDRIVIKMPKNQFKIYAQLSARNRLKNQTQDILLAKIVMPVMIETFNELKQSADMYEDKLWFKSIIKAFEDKKIDFMKELEKEGYDSYYFSQILFDSVFSKALDQTLELMTLGEEQI